MSKTMCDVVTLKWLVVNFTPQGFGYFSVRGKTPNVFIERPKAMHPSGRPGQPRPCQGDAVG